MPAPRSRRQKQSWKRLGEQKSGKSRMLSKAHHMIFHIRCRRIGLRDLRMHQSGRSVKRAPAECGADKTGCGSVDQYDSGADAAYYPVPDFRGNDMGAGSYTHGARGDWR